MKKLNTNTRNQIVNEVYNNLFTFIKKQRERYDKKFERVYKVMLKSPVCDNIKYYAKYQDEYIRIVINSCVRNITTLLVKNEIGNAPEIISWMAISNELVLFETTQDFDKCEDAYEVIECLYDFFVERL